MSLKINITEKQDGVFVITPVGSIDSDTYGELEKKVLSILKPTTTAVIFDMKELTYITSMGFSILFKTKVSLEKNGGTMAITNLQPQVKKIFDIVKVIPENLFATMDAADDYLDTFIANMHRKHTEKDKKD